MSLHSADAGRLLEALRGACTFKGETLPEPLPSEPMGLFTMWLGDAAAAKTQPNPNAMTLATVDGHGRPASRVVLARGVDPARGFINFYTNRQGAKGVQLGTAPYAALGFHWDHLERQVRIEGPVTPCPEAESDAYFASRPVLSRVAAWASDQSRPLASRTQLADQYRRALERFGLQDQEPPRGTAVNIPRPPHWGGYRVWAERVELWLGHSNRLHDRAEWTRTLTPATIDGVPGFEGGQWEVQRLQP